MANTTITTPLSHRLAGGTITLNGGTSSFIQSNQSKKESILTPLPLYLTDSEDTEVFDYGGTIKSINITGVYVGTTVANIKQFIDDMEGLIQGHQEPSDGYPLSLVDDYRGTVLVKIMDFDSTNEAAETLIIRWTLKTVQASTNA